MEIRISGEELQKRRLFLGLPCYDGQCAAIFARSMMDLSALCTHYGIPIQAYYLMNESLITRARAYICDEFMRSNSTHLMFVDSDIGFNPQDVLALLALASDDSPYDVIGGPYPKKCISWEKIRLAVDKGKAEQNPNDLEKYVGDYVFNPKDKQQSILISEPAEVLEIGTGFMMIRKQTLERYKEAYPELSYRPDHVRTEAFDGRREIMMYFDAAIDPATKRYLSEDYKFCYDCQKIGMKVWLCPWMQLNHVGRYVFGGSLADLAQIGAAATADPNALKKGAVQPQAPTVDKVPKKAPIPPLTRAVKPKKHRK